MSAGPALDGAETEAVARAERAAALARRQADADAQSGPPPAPATQKLQPLYPNVEAWVGGVLAVVFVRRTTSTFRWCRQWWRHPEAIVRLESLWRSWELLRLDPTTGMGIWFRDHLDHQLPTLTGPSGPFADCDPSQHYEPDPPALPVTPAPAHWWDVPTTSPTDTGDLHA
jgi:hypothetical protein